MGGIKPAGVAGGTGAAAIAIIALLLLAFGKCNFLIRPTASIHPTPTPSAAAFMAESPSPSAFAAPTVATTPPATPTPTVTPTRTPQATSRAVFITSLPWHAGEVSIPYAAVTLVAAGGTPPYKWSIDPGGNPIPSGLTLSSDGAVSGNPSATGGPFIVHVEDAAGHAAGAKTTIPISARFAPTSFCGPNGCSVEQGCVNVCGTYANLVGGVGPFQYSLTGGSLPAGTTFGGPSLGGSFVRPGSFPFTVEITDSFGVKAPVSALINVFTHIALSAGGGGGPLPNGPATVRMPLSADPSTKITSVTTSSKYTVSSFSYDGKTLTFTLTGTWSGTTQPPFQATVFDNSQCGPGVRCSSTAQVDLSMG